MKDYCRQHGVLYMGSVRAVWAPPRAWLQARKERTVVVKRRDPGIESRPSLRGCYRGRSQDCFVAGAVVFNVVFNVLIRIAARH